ncbi:hypothetical protein CXG81DRAFT_26629 [Caulochytrium protostelioides]|uniref:F-box domain-containing protein n=1 Tax=Caulochytrium protostelioides TaxID=1555241 RepID=A0A4P9X684_9FUNG|nr:hypothetical protein CXG81DRAFT_26629 [Caulochytrium protostelioides]|eukprot:RKP00684.1 hypothetical protein CXG81DRAFT_26629 [Caulochytrium protostelioides]
MISLTTLPAELLTAILRHLPPHEALRVGATCRATHELMASDAFWSDYAVTRFGLTAVAEVRNASVVDTAADTVIDHDGGISRHGAIYRRLHLAARRADATTFHGAHLPTHYWQRVPDPTTTTGVALKLTSVCWLDVAADLPGVLPGWYQPEWRIRSPISRNNAEIMLSAEVHVPPDRAVVAPAMATPQAAAEADAQQHVTHGDDIVYAESRVRLGSTRVLHPATRHRATLNTTEWSVVQGAPIEVVRPPAAAPGASHRAGRAVHVRLRMRDIAPVWKVGIVIDTVALRPIDVAETHTWRRRDDGVFEPLPGPSPAPDAPPTGAATATPTTQASFAAGLGRVVDLVLPHIRIGGPFRPPPTE